ncbi:MAG: asparaginase domain-containing protein [Myxococcota bacterium]
MERVRIALISTGGTIEKTYDELQGMLVNEASNLDVMLARLSLEGVALTRIPLMNKDSGTMTEGDHGLIADTAAVMIRRYDGVVIVHGTDTLEVTGERIYSAVKNPRGPIVLTGAMRPYQLRNSDAMQNLTEALTAVQLASPGVYVSMHNRLTAFPGAVKDRRRGTFARKEDIERMRTSPGALKAAEGAVVATSPEQPYDPNDHE